MGRGAEITTTQRSNVEVHKRGSEVYPRTVRVGTHVEVRNRFEAKWSRGFEVAEEQRAPDTERYRVRRRSDGTVLPAWFNGTDLREEHRRQTWWMS